jgi:hypothetical protein
MGVSRQRLDQPAQAGRLIALTDRSDRHVYPAWQFNWMLTGGDGAMLSIVAGRDAARSAP